MTALLTDRTTNVPGEVLSALTNGQKETARVSLLSLVRQAPDNAFGWLCLATTLPREQAIQAVRRAVLLEPDNGLAQRSLVRLLWNNEPGFSLEVTDLLQPATEEEALAEFGQEQATMQLDPARLEARFGEELPTLPGAFLDLAKVASILNETEALPAVSVSSLLAELEAEFAPTSKPATEPVNSKPAEPLPEEEAEVTAALPVSEAAPVVTPVDTLRVALAYQTQPLPPQSDPEFSWGAAMRLAACAILAALIVAVVVYLVMVSGIA